MSVNPFNNNSPWLYQLKQKKYLFPGSDEKTDAETDVAIIGGGIAGIATAFFLLTYTNARVTLLEGYKIAHGATGHNAGQITSYFERSIQSMVDEYGFDLALEAQKSVDTAWHLLDEMYTDTELSVPFSRFIGHSGLSSKDQIVHFLKENQLRKKAGIAIERIRIAEESGLASQLGEEGFADLFEVVPQAKILQLLETTDTTYTAVLSFQKGCLNSALFCYEAVTALLKKYPNRFSLREQSPVSKVILKPDEALLDVGTYSVKAKRVVLCTNGFERMAIIDQATGLDIHAKFHHHVYGTVGYMSGYTEKLDKPPTAISYFTDPNLSNEDPYYYMTRRPFENEQGEDTNLICIGGPEGEIDVRSSYAPTDAYPEKAAEDIDVFVKKTLAQEQDIEYAFTWHGLMGYTKNRMRMVGEEPLNPVLLYNLGCNGVGILPSLFGGRKIASILAHEKQEKSIFDIPRVFPK